VKGIKCKVVTDVQRCAIICCSLTIGSHVQPSFLLLRCCLFELKLPCPLMFCMDRHLFAPQLHLRLDCFFDSCQQYHMRTLSLIVRDVQSPVSDRFGLWIELTAFLIVITIIMPCSSSVLSLFLLVVPHYAAIFIKRELF
jgi:hypothetical protein